MRFTNLDDWLHWQESLNPAEIDLGLDRVDQVLRSLGHTSHFPCPLITVAGTNGKGSVVAMLEAIARRAGLQVACYTSPHMLRYNERIRIDGASIDDESLCAAFQRVDEARDEVPLTYFEFGTLAAIDLFFRLKPDLVILEVGLGGRLDAVNVMDADVAILTTVAIDHTDWLGDNREDIGREKAGIFRTGILAVAGDRNLPDSVRRHADDIGCRIRVAGRDFRGEPSAPRRGEDDRWRYVGENSVIDDLPYPSLAGTFQMDNASLAITALLELGRQQRLYRSAGNTEAGMIPERLAVDEHSLHAAFQALSNTSLRGRFQQVHARPAVYVDVAHNPQAAASLASVLHTHDSGTGKTWAVIAMMADKDITSVLQALCGEIDSWCFCDLKGVSRAISAVELADIARKAGVISGTTGDVPVDTDTGSENRSIGVSNQCTMTTDGIFLFASIADALEHVLPHVDERDRVIVAGSFYTVSAALSYFGQ